VRTLVIVPALLLLARTAAVAQEEVPLQSKPPKTASETALLVKDAARLASELKDTDDAIAENEARTIKLAKQMDMHNDVGCAFTDKNPTACDGWIAQGKALNTQMDYLVNEHEQQLIRAIELRAYLNMRRSRLRLMVLLDGLTEWQREVVRCAQLPSLVGSKACMAEAWERHP